MVAPTPRVNFHWGAIFRFFGRCDTCDKQDGLATTMEHSGKNHINPTILLHLPLDSYSFFIMFLLEIEMDHLLESYSNIAIGQIRLDQLDLANLSKSHLSITWYSYSIL